MEYVTGQARQRARTEILLTAAEAYPVFERAVLSARQEIWGSFRILDPETRLRSPEAQAVGNTWFDLLVDALRRGVAVHLALTDFDPIARPSLHQGTWAAMRRLLAAAEVAGPRAAPLRVRAALHPATTGFLLRTACWPQATRCLRRTARWLNAQDPAKRKAALRDMPALAPLLRFGPNGEVRPVVWGLPRLHPATHHQKMAVFDRRRLYIGGLDLDERRWDTPEHDRPGQETWHDLQLMIEGPVVAEAQSHVESFLDVTAGQAEPLPQRRLLRTMSRPCRSVVAGFGPETVAHEILDGHTMLAGRSEKLIYLETQFFRDIGLARSLAKVGREKPGLGLILMLPGAPEEVAFGHALGLDARYGEFLQARCLRILGRAFGPRLFVGGAAQPRSVPHAAPAGAKAAGPEGRDGPEELDGEETSEGSGRDRLNGAPIVYIHAKVSIFDDAAAIVSSANLNGRSLRWDTEAGVYLTSVPDVHGLRERVMRHWLPRNADPSYLDPARAVAMWQRLAQSNARRPPDRREGFLLPYDLKAAERIARPLPGVPEEMV